MLTLEISAVTRGDSHDMIIIPTIFRYESNHITSNSALYGFIL